MGKVKYPVHVPCENEWGLRSLMELVAHITQWYRHPTHRRIEAITSALSRIRPTIPQRREAYHRLATRFTSVCEAIADHSRVEDQILCPAIANVQQSRSGQGGGSHESALPNQSEREALCHRIVSVAGEHNSLRHL